MLNHKLIQKFGYKILNTGTAFYVALCFVILAYIFYISFKTVNWPYDLNPVEGTMMFNLREFKVSNNLYGKSQYALEYINTYSPGYYLLVAAVDYIVNISSTLQNLRLFTIILELATGLIIFLIVKLHTNKSLYGFISFTIYLGLISVNKFHALLRIDFLYVLLTAISIYFLTSYNIKQKYFKLILFTLFGALAIFTKISAVTVFITIAIYQLFKYKGKKQQLIATTALFLMFLFLFVITNILTQGNFYLHTIEYQINKPLDPGTALFHLLDLSTTYLVLIPAVIFLFSKYKNQIDTLYLTLFLVTLTEATVSVFKRGGDLNYFILPITLLCIALLTVNKYHSKVYGIMLVVCILLLSSGGYYRPYLNQVNYNNHKQLENIIVKINDNYLVSSNVYIPYKNNITLLTNDLFQYSTNVSVRNSKDYVNKQELNEFTYIITDPYVRRFQNFPYQNYEMHYNLQDGYIKWEVWKQK